MSPETMFHCIACHGIDATSWLQAPDRFNGRREPYRLVRCPNCSLVWLVDPPKPSEMPAHYGAGYDLAVGKVDRSARWRERSAAVHAMRSSGALLDIGCSSGSFLECMKSPDWNLYGIEMSPQTAALARQRSGARIFVGDILDAPFAPGSFDVITCFDVLEHTYDPRRVLSKVLTWLKPDGVLYLMVPNVASAGARMFGSYWYALELPRHLYHFSPASLARLLEASRFQKITLRTQRLLYFEESTRYLLDACLGVAGITRPPLASRGSTTLAWRIVRKAFRLSLLPALTFASRLMGDGERIHAVYRKPAHEGGSPDPVPASRTGGVAALCA